MLLITTPTPEGRHTAEFTADSPFALSVKFPEDTITVRNCRILTAAGDSDLSHLKSYFQLPLNWEKEIPINVFPRRIRLEFITCPLELEVTFHKMSADSIPDEVEQRIADLETKASTLQGILSTEDLDGNGIPDGEDRIRGMEDSLNNVVTSDDIINEWQ